MKTTKPSKQRKRMHLAPLNERYKKFSAPLSPKLKESQSTNSVPVRTGDTVTIMRGDRKGIEGKVNRIDRKKYRIFVEGVTREKVDGTTTLIPIHPSKVMITRLNLDDKWRRNMLKRKGAVEIAEMPKEKIVEEKRRKLQRKKQKRREHRARPPRNLEEHKNGEKR